MPSYYLAVFYSGLVLGSGMLALGIWDNARLLFLLPKGKPPRRVLFGFLASSLLVFAVIAGAYNYCNGQAQYAASAKKPKLNAASVAFEGCMSDPKLLLIAWVPTFRASHPQPPHNHPQPPPTPLRWRSHLSCPTRPAVSLFIWTTALFFMNNVERGKQFKYFTKAMLCLALGVISSIIVTVTGYQQLHVPTALGFFLLFFTELYFIIYVVPDSYNTGSNQASV